MLTCVIDETLFCVCVSKGKSLLLLVTSDKQAKYKYVNYFPSINEEAKKALAEK
jgi:hypothetical protein